MDEIGFDARRLGIKQALIFTDRHVAELGLPERVRALLEEQGVKADVFDGVEVEPTDRSMEEAARVRAAPRSSTASSRSAAAARSTPARRSNLLTTLPGAAARLHQQAGGRGVPVPGPLRAADRGPDDGGHRQRDDRGGGDARRSIRT